MLRQRVAVVAVLVVVVLLGVVPAGESTHLGDPCASTLETIPVGTGAVGGGVSALHGINHFDLSYPSCSSGRFWVGHGSGGVVTEQHCSEGFLRVYGPPGALGNQVIINWVAASGGSCA